MKLPVSGTRVFFHALRASIVLILVSVGAVSAASAQGAGYWHTSGAQIYDSNNQPVRIAGINWYGFETTDLVAHGLASQDYKSILQTIKTQGYNTIRIPFSNQMVEIPGTNLNISYWANFGPINTDLQGLNSLQVLDKIVTYAGTVGLKVILDNHRSEAGNSAEANGLWYTSSYPESNWIADWQALATRYAGDPTVIGMDLRNEPHNAYSGGACWDCGGANDWHLAAARGGNAVLAINPNLLIFVEGTDAYNNDYYWWGGNLEGVANSPVTLSVANRLVYSAHDYGPNEYQQTWFNGSTTPASLDSVWTTHWAYISQQGKAPVWLGEFGTENSDSDVQGTGAGSQGQWFQSLTTFLKSNPALNWTYWALNGEDAYGLLDSNYDPTPADALKQSTLASIQFALNTGSGNAGTTPAAPSALNATATSASQINLAWTASTTSGVTYTVFFGTSSGSIGTVLASGLTTSSYAATGLNPSTGYYFDVEAVSTTGNSPLSNTASATTQAAPATPAPGTPSAVVVSSSQINLSWTANASGQTYSVYSGTSAGSVSNLLASGLSGTTYSVTNLSANTTYYFTIVATAGTVTSAPSGVGSATTLAPPPPVAPSGLTASAISSSQINLSWAASSSPGITYTVYSGSTAIASGLSATSYAVTGLTASTIYSYTVVAASSTGTSTPSNTASATTLAATITPPVAPYGLAASPGSASQVNLNWQPSTTSGVTYTVYMGTASGATTTVAASGVSGQFYAVPGLLDNTTYYFTVKAVSSGGSSAASNQVSATTQALPATPPTGLTASTVSATQINLSWTAVANTGATYAVYSGTSSGAENTLLATAISATTYQATNLTASTTYYFVVRSISAGGASSPSGQVSATTQAAGVPVVPVTPPSNPTPPTAPSGLVATAISPTQITLAWSPSTTSGVTYTVYTGSSAIASGLAGTSYSATGLTASTTYSFTVMAISSAGTSPASNPASATTQATPAPSAPTGLAATATSSSQINLAWSPSPTSGVTYTIYSGAASGAETSVVASGISGTSYPVGGLNASTAYYFIVKAVATGGTSPASNEASATTQAAATGGCHVAYVNQNDWGAGFTGNMSITNNGPTAWTSWTVTWTYGGNQQIYTSWDGNYTQNGQQVSIASAAWNGSVAAGGTVSGIGWNANYSGTNTNPTAFYVNGVLCH